MTSKQSSLCLHHIKVYGAVTIRIIWIPTYYYVVELAGSNVEYVVFYIEGMKIISIEIDVQAHH